MEKVMIIVTNSSSYKIISYIKWWKLNGKGNDNSY
jgi:hypothetical protein